MGRSGAATSTAFERGTDAGGVGGGAARVVFWLGLVGGDCGAPQPKMNGAEPHAARATSAVRRSHRRSAMRSVPRRSSGPELCAARAVSKVEALIETIPKTESVIDWG